MRPIVAVYGRAAKFLSIMERNVKPGLIVKPIKVENYFIVMTGKDCSRYETLRNDEIRK